MRHAAGLQVYIYVSTRLDNLQRYRYNGCTSHRVDCGKQCRAQQPLAMDFAGVISVKCSESRRITGAEIPILIPAARRKSFRRDQRLQAAKNWLPTYEGKNVFRGYRKRYGVDWPTALRELEMLGVEVTPAYREQVLRTVQEQAEARQRKRLEKAAELESALGIEQDEYFAYIIGYTSGGAPYGITWEEWEELDDSEAKKDEMSWDTRYSSINDNPAGSE